MSDTHPATPLPPEPEAPEGLEDVPRVDFDVHTGDSLGEDELED